MESENKSTVTAEAASSPAAATPTKTQDVNGVNVLRVLEMARTNTVVEGATDDEQDIAKRVRRRLKEAANEGYPPQVIGKQIRGWIVRDAMKLPVRQ